MTLRGGFKRQTSLVATMRLCWCITAIGGHKSGAAYLPVAEQTENAGADRSVQNEQRKALGAGEKSSLFLSLARCLSFSVEAVYQQCKVN